VEVAGARLVSGTPGLLAADGRQVLVATALLVLFWSRAGAIAAFGVMGIGNAAGMNAMAMTC
jgi:hypothetical protein